MESCVCSLCQRPGSEVVLDVYNDTEDFAGDLICDDCVCASIVPGPRVAMPVRAEGYYHRPLR